MLQHYPEKASTRGEENTHTPHHTTPHHTTHTWNMDKIYEQQFRKERKEEEDQEEESTWRCLGHPRRRWFFPNHKEGSAYQGTPRRAVYAAQGDRKHWTHVVRAEPKAWRFALLPAKVCAWGLSMKAWSGKSARYQPESSSGLGTCWRKPSTREGSPAKYILGSKCRKRESFLFRKIRFAREYIREIMLLEAEKLGGVGKYATCVTWM